MRNDSQPLQPEQVRAAVGVRVEPRAHPLRCRADQETAYAAVRRGVIEYDRRHGYRGPETYVSLPTDPAEQDQVLESAFADAADFGCAIAPVRS